MFYFGTNTKLQHTPDQSAAFVRAVAQALAAQPLDRPAQLWYCPPYTSLATVAEVCRHGGMLLGAQNCHWEDAGAATGEMSPAVLRACGAQFVLLGHAERRARYCENDAQLNLKIQAARRNGLGVMLCVGEDRDQKARGATHATLDTQLRVALQGAAPDGLMVLYEPVWSIGAGAEAAQPDHVAKAFGWVREILAALYPGRAVGIPALYGGSVNIDNARALAATPGCDGLGVGRAAWDAQDFVRVLRAACNAPCGAMP